MLNVCFTFSSSGLRQIQNIYNAVFLILQNNTVYLTSIGYFPLMYTKYKNTVNHFFSCCRTLSKYYFDPVDSKEMTTFARNPLLMSLKMQLVCFISLYLLSLTTIQLWYVFFLFLQQFQCTFYMYRKLPIIHKIGWFGNCG